MKNKVVLVLVIAAVVIVVAALMSPAKQVVTLGTSIQGGENYATTTAASGATYAKPTYWLIKGGPGSFSQVVQLKAGTAGGDIALYDATTTNVSLRTGQLATSSIFIASIPTDLAVGTYTFDANFRWGLLAVTTGTVGTTTILYR